MRLQTLLGDLVTPASSADVDVVDVQIDSRRCTPGSVFFAMPGATTSGTTYVDEAVARGAVAVVSDARVTTTVPVIHVPSARLHDLLVTASAEITQHPERQVRLLGVTGTNGKTSVTTIFASLWRALGRAGDVIGTLTHERTTPAPPELFRELARLVGRNADGVDPLMAIEVSSHALTQGRVDGLTFDVAVFTNLSLDHLDYHGSMESYFAAKASLFTPTRSRVGVIWIDDEYGRRLASSATVPVVPVARTEATSVELSVGRTTFQWRGHTVRTRLSGEYNVDNTLMVLHAATQFGVREEDAVAALATASGVPGRFEVVRESDPTVVVDYAHTPDGLERVLVDARSFAPHGRVIVVFGCGGDRDRSKRPVMGEIATRLADEVVFTSDNPRHEDPERIIDEIVAGCRDGSVWRRESDRRRAIQGALESARTGDLVLIAGKGHEKTQIVGDDVLDFDDRVVAAEFLR